MAQLNLNVKNATNQTIIYINGQRLSEKIPIVGYNLVPFENILVEVKDPFSGKSARQQIRLDAGQNYTLDLVMK